MISGNETRSSGLRILVVEDEFLIADDIAFTLEGMGHEVVGPAPTIEQAIALVESEALDCVLLDANLQGESSAPIAAELKSRSIAFIVVTGYGNLTLATDDLDTALRVTKPVSAPDLAARLAEALAC